MEDNKTASGEERPTWRKCRPWNNGDGPRGSEAGVPREQQEAVSGEAGERQDQTVQGLITHESDFGCYPEDTETRGSAEFPLLRSKQPQ
jgi:hypothetical protein